VRALVKIGGTLLESEESRRRLVGELAGAAARGVRLVVVHGGGKQMTRYLSERGIESRFVGGLRVTTPETLDAVVKVVAGSVNHELVAAFVEAGARAVGLSGVDAGLVQAEPMDPALGAVGRPVRAGGELLELLTGAGYLPVLACVAGDGRGRIFNVNADQMAAACAAGFGADRLLFLTDVAGVLDQNGEVLPELTAARCRELIAAGVARGGMQAKLNAALEALRGGVGQVEIAPGAAAGVMPGWLEGAPVGTRILGEGAHD
jgi:acetylglutamate kinase